MIIVESREPISELERETLVYTARPFDSPVSESNLMQPTSFVGIS